MKKILLALSFLLIGFATMAQYNPVKNITEWPTDVPESDVALYLSFGNKENAAEKEKLSQRIQDSLSRYGVTITQTLVFTSTANAVNESNAFLAKYHPKYVISISSFKMGYTGAFSSAATSSTDTVSMKMYPIEKNPDALLSNIQQDIELMLDRRAGDESNSTASNSFELMPATTGDAKAIQSAPTDLPSKKLAVVIASGGFGSSSKQHIQEESTNEKIKEIMKTYPYEYEIISYSEYSKNPSAYAYALLYYKIIKREEYYKTVTSSSGVSRQELVRKDVPHYYLYLKSAQGDVYQLFVDWHSTYVVTKAYKKFVKYYEKK